jgi:hypothetical protein
MWCRPFGLQFTHPQQPTWFRDGGGRDNYLGGGVELRRAIRTPSGDWTTEPVLLGSVPGTVSLLYESGEPVSDQSILWVVAAGAKGATPLPRYHSSDPSIATQLGLNSSHHGVMTLRAKITEISKNHMNRRFRVCVSVIGGPTGSLAPIPLPPAPAGSSSAASLASSQPPPAPTGPVFYDAIPAQEIAPALSNPVTVKSKPPKPRTGGARRADALTSVSPTSEKGSPNSPEFTAALPAMPTANPMPLAAAARVGSMAVDSQRLGGALNRVVAWINDAVILVSQALQWQAVAYRPTSAGAPDKSSPVISCPCCGKTHRTWELDRDADDNVIGIVHEANCPIHMLLEQYAGATVGALNEVISAVHSDSSQRFSSGLSVGAALRQSQDVLGSAAAVPASTGLTHVLGRKRQRDDEDLARPAAPLAPQDSASQFDDIINTGRTHTAFGPPAVMLDEAGSFLEHKPRSPDRRLRTTASYGISIAPPMSRLMSNDSYVTGERPAERVSRTRTMGDNPDEDEDGRGGGSRLSEQPTDEYEESEPDMFGLGRDQSAAVVASPPDGIATAHPAKRVKPTASDGSAEGLGLGRQLSFGVSHTAGLAPSWSSNPGDLSDTAHPHQRFIVPAGAARLVSGPMIKDEDEDVAPRQIGRPRRGSASSRVVSGMPQLSQSDSMDGDPLIPLPLQRTSSGMYATSSEGLRILPSAWEDSGDHHSRDGVGLTRANSTGSEWNSAAMLDRATSAERLHQLFGVLPAPPLGTITRQVHPPSHGSVEAGVTVIARLPVQVGDRLLLLAASDKTGSLVGCYISPLLTPPQTGKRQPVPAHLPFAPLSQLRVLSLGDALATLTASSLPASDLPVEDGGLSRRLVDVDSALETKLAASLRSGSLALRNGANEDASSGGRDSDPLGGGRDNPRVIAARILDEFANGPSSTLRR